MRHSYSSLRTLQECERKFAYRYVEGLSPIGDEPIKFLRGHAFHALVQADLLQRGAQKGSLLSRPDKFTVFQGSLELGINWSNPELPTIASPDHGPELPLTPFTVIDHMRVWEAGLVGERRDAIESDLGASLCDRMTELWHRYAAHWFEETNRQLPLLTEQWWMRVAPNGRVLQGRIDAVVYDPETALCIVRDTKTHESWPSESDTVMDLMESQNHMNLWGVAPDLRQLSEGLYVPQAVEFDRVRTKRPTEPKLTQKGVLSLSIKDFDGYTYTNWCATKPTFEVKVKGQDEPSIEVYTFDQAVYDKAEENREAWFRRSLKPLSMNAVTAHVMAAQAQAARAEVLTTADSGLAPSKNCGWCDYSQLCRAEIIGGKIENLVPQDWNLRRKSR